jgi:hypothetical protein
METITTQNLQVADQGSGAFLDDLFEEGSIPASALHDATIPDGNFFDEVEY